MAKVDELWIIRQTARIAAYAVIGVVGPEIEKLGGPKFSYKYYSDRFLPLIEEWAKDAVESRGDVVPPAA
ncbi:MAG TPA: hypothetical protein VMW93_04520 [bacterium]|nr:hypothetical protein [bacterium]